MSFIEFNFTFSTINLKLEQFQFRIYTFLVVNIVLVVIPVVQDFAVTALGVGICIAGFGLYFLFVRCPRFSPTIFSTINGWLVGDLLF